MAILIGVVNCGIVEEFRQRVALYGTYCTMDIERFMYRIQRFPGRLLPLIEYCQCIANFYCRVLQGRCFYFLHIEISLLKTILCVLHAEHFVLKFLTIFIVRSLQHFYSQEICLL